MKRAPEKKDRLHAHVGRTDAGLLALIHFDLKLSEATAGRVSKSLLKLEIFKLQDAMQLVKKSKAWAAAKMGK